MSLKIKKKDREHALLERGFLKLSAPVKSFIDSQVVTGIVLFVSVIIAMVMVNFGWQQTYDALNAMKLSVSLGDWEMSHSIHYWINDGLMVLFFFILGLEIKYEVLVGALSNIKDAGLVIAMAVGGMLFPALIYISIIWYGNSDAYQGWGIPMATDTAFAISILTLLGAKAPRAIFVMLTGLAIVDDMGAVAVISLFYTEQIVGLSLVWAGLTLLSMLLMNLLGIRKPIFYLAGGVLLWWFILQSGVHATTAGILAAMMIPTHPHANKIWFRKKMESVVENFQEMKDPHKPIIENQDQHALAVKAEDIAKLSTAPILRWGYTLDKPVSLIILPLFAFLNAGVMLPTAIPKVDDSLITLAIVAALVLGKGIGISLFAWLGLKIGLVRLPSSVSFSQIVGVGFLAGVGFTMSLFISVLAFKGQAELIEQAKLGILLGSIIAGILGMAILLFTSKN